ncbi:hypothetical protein AN218_29320 [Streptomyces nanshensis]|uniref:Monooxygenase n=1 Tax=Streptomyces nanshensis TaxID=518642 RepID=A0A1E7KTY0_9ACTN|nr:hypothetical protein AN218_29320 [Streptomyces nanshensis]
MAGAPRAERSPRAALDNHQAPAARREVRAALIRPDGHVAWAGTDQDTTALPAALGTFVAA